MNLKDEIKNLGGVNEEIQAAQIRQATHWTPGYSIKLRPKAGEDGQTRDYFVVTYHDKDNKKTEKKEVAEMALFLASPAADYITGQNMILDGGMTVSINKLWV